MGVHMSAAGREAGRGARLARRLWVGSWLALALGGVTGLAGPGVLRGQDVSPQAGELPPVRILIVYHSVTGNTEKMALAVAEGVATVPGATPVVKRTDAVTADDLRTARGIILGSPTYWFNMAAPLKSFIDDWWFVFKVPLADKVGGSFASGLGGGTEHVTHSLNLAMIAAGMIVVGPLDDSGLGRSGVTALSPPGEPALQECRGLGERIARLAQQIAATH
jgi:NAD(P)H dehydrogenase (quinone)